MTRPLVLLDVDGVVNAVHPDRAAGSFDDFRQLPQRHWLNFSAKQGARLTELREKTDLVWHTTWQAGTLVRILTKLLGWEDTPVLHPITWDYNRPDVGWWKSPVAERFILERQQRFVWIDDDLEAGTREFDTLGWVVESGLDHLLVCPTWELGLTPHELDLIEEWVG